MSKITHKKSTQRSHIYRPMDRLCKRSITDAIDQSPGAMVAKLPENEQAEVLRTEWLVEDPFCGICTGLAIEYLLNTELQGDAATSLPSDEARYWIKLLLPNMAKVMQEFYCNNPNQLNQERHYDAMYKLMIEAVQEKAHLKASIRALHAPLGQLGEVLNNQVGHSLVIVELPGTPICANHTIYFNATTHTITDNGMIIHVPEEDDFGTFVDFYMERMQYPTRADRFTLMSVEKDPQYDCVRKPSMLDRASLAVEITFNSLLRQTYDAFSYSMSNNVEPMSHFT